MRAPGQKAGPAEHERIWFHIHMWKGPTFSCTRPRIPQVDRFAPGASPLRVAPIVYSDAIRSAYKAHLVHRRVHLLLLLPRVSDSPLPWGFLRAGDVIFSDFATVNVV